MKSRKMIKILFLILFFAIVCSASLLTVAKGYLFAKYDIPNKVRTLEDYNKNIDENVLDFFGLVQQYEEYKSEEHNVTTTDGYILTLHRITNNSSSTNKDAKPVVYLQHGATGISDLWVTNRPKYSLAFKLVDEGYDVWLGNSRGNFHSRSHVKYSPDKDNKEYWDFSLDEMGAYDLSASIDYILIKTNQKNLTYIGLSLGSTLSYILLSAKPEYNQKINLLVSMAPVASFTKSPYHAVRAFLTIYLTYGTLMNTYEIFPLTTETGKFARDLCDDSIASICKLYLSTMSDIDHADFLHVIRMLHYMPAGISYKAVNHMLQTLNHEVFHPFEAEITKYETIGKLRKYDYGCNFLWCNNEKVYQQNEPPEYDFNLVTAPTVLVWSEDDAYVKPEDVEYLKSKLNNVVGSIKISIEKFNHLDFFWSPRVDEVYDKIIETVKSKSNIMTKYQK